MTEKLVGKIDPEWNSAFTELYKTVHSIIQNSSLLWYLDTYFFICPQNGNPPFFQVSI
jgi:hypothetical protein